jgi:Holliday junction resolvase-like predicted endonuclease
MENYDMFDNEAETEDTVTMNKTRKGDLAEHKAVTWLWERGYEVFLNCGGSGPIDIVAYKDGECTLIDVKTIQKERRPHKGTWKITTPRTDEQKENNIVYLSYYPESGDFRWINHKD